MRVLKTILLILSYCITAVCMIITVSLFIVAIGVLAFKTELRHPIEPVEFLWIIPLTILSIISNWISQHLHITYDR
jgi:hypothetical protein